MKKHVKLQVEFDVSIGKNEKFKNFRSDMSSLRQSIKDVFYETQGFCICDKKVNLGSDDISFIENLRIRYLK